MPTTRDMHSSLIVEKKKDLITAVVRKQYYEMKLKLEADKVGQLEEEIEQLQFHREQQQVHLHKK